MHSEALPQPGWHHVLISKGHQAVARLTCLGLLVAGNSYQASPVMALFDCLLPSLAEDAEDVLVEHNKEQVIVKVF